MDRMTKSLAVVMLAIVQAFPSIPRQSFAAVPTSINYQGYLTDAAGVPVNGTVAMTFSLYTAATGTAAPLWSETMAAVNVTNGVYSAALGFPTPLNLPFDTQYFLGVAVGSDTEMTPRTRLRSAPYAMRAATADGLATTVTSSTTVGNLNADLLDGMHASSFMSAAADNWVNVGGDTMIGPLVIPANGLTIGTNQLVAASSKVGIGTAAPSYPLTVEYTPSVNNINPVALFRAAGATTSVGAVRVQNTQSNYFNMGIANDNSFALNYNANISQASDLLRLTSSGNVGIGTTTPASKLTVNGMIESTSGGIKFPDGTVQATRATPANTVVVDPSGSGYTTIQAAINAISPTAANPYIVEVRAGTYVESITLKSHVHLKGAGRDVTFIAPVSTAVPAITLNGLSNIKISGFTFQPYADPAQRGMYWGIYDSGSSPKFFECRFTHNLSGRAGIRGINSSPEIFDNEFSDSEGSAIFYEDSAHVVIRDNLFDLHLHDATIWLLDSYGTIERNKFLNNITGDAINVSASPGLFDDPYALIAGNYFNGGIRADIHSMIIEGNHMIDGYLLADGENVSIVGNTLMIDTLDSLHVAGGSASIAGNTIWGNITIANWETQVIGNTLFPMRPGKSGIDCGSHIVQISGNSIMGGEPSIKAGSQTQITGNYIKAHTSSVAIDTSESIGLLSIWGNQIDQNTPDTVGNALISSSPITLSTGTNTISIPTIGNIGVTGALDLAAGTSRIKVPYSGTLELVAGANALKIPTSGTNDILGSTKVTGNLQATGTMSVGSILSANTINASGLVSAGSVVTSSGVSIGGNLTVQGQATSTVSGVDHFMVPRGAIILWSGATTSIPSGWALCDGANGTPDLRDRFVAGAGSTYAVGDTGGAATHSHARGTYASPSHTHTVSGTVDASSSFVLAGPGGLMVSAANHTHAYSDTTQVGQGGGAISGTSADGSSLPPYYSLAYIMRL